MVGSINLRVHVGRLSELVNVFQRKRLAVAAILKCDFSDQFTKCNYPKTRSVKLTDGQTGDMI